ncbi:PREDICTED: GDSL esterase/lipase At5g03610-like [Nelumbo nucifera]|uniref:GDSL esterase/lipase At5g03610-like n=2 Tax=Nelumbo nucifera TaxID=4432 RepID=A0A1U7ZAW2_NELNU|nr:PREDICTED: GDSL esterase/lipase At5g03610-like [Nelumbo nucifera]DAD48599.1 TPA_asm: hypothetical protein HUJ06_018536 [Nelumbo nucifera]
MGKQKKHILLFHLLFLHLLLAGVQVVESKSHHHLHGQNQVHGFSKLFAFGDSYADTGNSAKSTSDSWHEPYGITFPGKPSGRWSDGRVLTDYVASFIGIKSPIPRQWMKYGPKLVKFGINFAYGGSGVFETSTPVNMTVQINSFQQLIQQGLYTKKDLYSSVALVSLAGNDYNAYASRNGTAEGLPAFISSVVNQLALNLKRINVMGVKTIIVTALPPLDCLPLRTLSSSFQQCSETDNAGVIFHNQLLQQAVDKLNNQSKDSTFLTLDLYRSFKTILNQTALPAGNMKFDDPLKPCCMGVNSSYSCGSKDENGVRMYTVCKNPKTAFFWDMFHPTQEGWKAVRLLLDSYLFPPKP